ncbi:MAG TPA: hypothetical protein VFP61_15040 [Acidimicrobiales bacterium]|nr:hypothetical protein [Acidimicrobiales bacterium]
MRRASAVGVLAVARAQVERGVPLRLSGAERVGAVVALALLAVAVGALGAYGWRRGATLLPRAIAPEQVGHRLAVLRRGSVACGVVAVALVAAAVLVALE